MEGIQMGKEERLTFSMAASLLFPLSQQLLEWCRVEIILADGVSGYGYRTLSAIQKLFG